MLLWMFVWLGVFPSQKKKKKSKQAVTKMLEFAVNSVQNETDLAEFECNTL